MLEGRLLAIGFEDLGVMADCPRCGRAVQYIDVGTCLIRVDEVGRTAHSGEVLLVVHSPERCNAGETSTDEAASWIGHNQ